MPEKLKFEHFEVLAREDGTPCELGRGAMGITYKAVDTNLGSPVAIKVINSAHLQHPQALERFQREARAAAALRHPNVASVFHLGMEGDVAFYAMEFVEGETVEALMRREGAIAPDMALEIAAQVCRALAAAEKRGLVHRDIKPANLMLLHREGEGMEVKVIDFGLAKPGEGSPDAATLTVGGFLGTPHFASPEQLEERPLDIRSDLYSLGATLWFMLSGQTPFTGSLAQVMSGHLHASPPLEKLPNLPAPIRELLTRFMAKDPADRPATATMARNEILACMEALSRLPAHTPETIAPPAPPAPDDTQGTEIFETSIMAGDEAPAPKFAEGALIAGRYEITAAGTPSELGEKFPAKRVDDSTACTLILLDAALLTTSEAWTRMEATVEALRGVDEEALIPVLSLESIGPVTFLVAGDCGGPTVLDLMRARRVLDSGMVIRLLGPVARALDLLSAKGIPLPQPGLHSLLLTDLETPGTPRFFPIAVPTGLEIPADATYVGSGDSPWGMGGRSGAEPGRVVGFLAYEMLGGMRGAGGTFVPVATLSEAGNQLLRQAMDQPARFSTASEFIAALSEEEPGLPEPPPPTKAAPPPLPSATTPPRKPPATKRILVTAGLATVVVCLLGVGMWFLVSRAESPTASAPPATPLPTPSPPARTAETVLTEVREAADPAAAANILLEGLSKFPGDSALSGELTAWIANLPQSGIPVEDLARLAPRIEDLEVPAPVAAWIGDCLLKEDPQTGFSWIKRAADAGDAGALAQLADCHNHGIGTPRDMNAYVATLRLVAETDNASAINKLGDIMKRGIPGIVTPDPVEAYRLFTKALELGYLDAQGNLGILTREGLGTGQPPDEEAAAALFLDGAEKGNALCMFFYALCLEIGSGVPQDQDAAKDWFQRSAKLGNPRAIERCRELGIEL